MAKRLAIQSEIVTFKNLSKDIWKIINRHRNKKQILKDKIILKTGNKTVSNPAEVVNIFADEFGRIFNHAQGYSQMAISILEQNTSRVENQILWDPVTSSEIFKLVSQMENKSSCGYDELPISSIKENIDILAEPITNLFNDCLVQGIFPDQFKIAKIVPIYKKGIKSDPSMYRPISLLPTMSKILEKVIKVRLIKHLNLNKVLHHRQFGYKTGVGTQDAIEVLVSDVVNRMNQKNKVAGLFLDLSAAFDTVNHELLLKKLDHYGVRGSAGRLFQSYLKNRKMFVELHAVADSNGYSSEYCCEETFKSKMTKIITGVPQGSILGPILFVTFINDLIHYVTNISMGAIQPIMFADDTNAIVSAESINSLSCKVNEALSTFHYWFSINCLKLNTGKTNIMLFCSTARNNDQLNCVLNGEIVNTVRTTKFLGVNVDEYLNWKNELTSLESAISSACYVLRSLRDEVGIKYLKMVYYALVESKLRYSILFWGGSYNYNISRAFILQKRAIRTITGIRQDVSCRPHFVELEILTVPSLYVLVLLTNFAKGVYKLETEEERQVRENTRRKDFQCKNTPRLNIVQHSSYYSAIKMFNKLPIGLKSLLYKSNFKNKLKSFLLEGCLYSLDDMQKCSYRDEEEQQ